MQMNEIDGEIVRGNRSQDQVISNSVRHEENNRTSAKQEAINKPSASQLSLTDSVDTRQQKNKSSELPQTMTKTEAVMQDVRRFKSATLDRMGKMFKTRNERTSSLGLDTNVTSVDNYDEKASRKAKTNSLGRMLKLTDKDGTPRKLFALSPRAGSLSRILRRHPHNEDNGVIDKPAEDIARGIFSRMFSQLRGRSTGIATKSNTYKPNHLDCSLSSEISLN